jgi:hypothetical protein
MEISKLTLPQQAALLEILILAMYADGSLDLEEDARLNRVLTAMGVETNTIATACSMTASRACVNIRRIRNQPGITPSCSPNPLKTPSNAAACINSSSNR